MKINSAKTSTKNSIESYDFDFDCEEDQAQQVAVKKAQDTHELEGLLEQVCVEDTGKAGG